MRIALLGYGRMGRIVETLARERGHDIVLRMTSADADEEAPEKGRSGLAAADVAIDFSVGAAVPDHVERAAATGTDIVIGTTGWDDRVDEVRGTVRESDIGCLYGPNFSLGAHLFFRLAARAAELAGALAAYDTHVVEAHHRHKRDHPSGTARHLAELLVGLLPDKERWREGPAGAGHRDTLEVTSIRAGERAGLHVVGLDGPDDRIEIRHEARGRTAFARGALDAAEWLEGRSGYFTIDDMLTDTFDAGETER